MSASKYYLLKNTLSEIEKKSEEIIVIDNQISKKQVEINKIKNEYRNITNEHNNKKTKFKKFEDESVDHVNADIKALKFSLKNAKKLEKEYSKSNCSGMTSSQFRVEKIDSEFRAFEAAWDEDKENFYGGLILLISFVIGLFLVFAVFDDNRFECTDGDGSVSGYWVLDDEEDCNDGSDEEESSSGEEQTRAEIHYDEDWTWIRDAYTVCCNPFVLAFLIPAIISKYKEAKNSGLENINLKIQTKLYAKHGKQIEELEKLETDRNMIERELRILNDKIKSHKKNKISIDNIAINIKNTKSKIEVEQSKLDDMVKNKSSLEEQVNTSWDKISDMIPYSNLLSFNSKSSAANLDWDL